MANKGSPYERSFCRQLSEWFSGGASDDWFWRSSTSGARATVRARKGQQTVGHCGDIAPCCPEAAVFTNFITTELKRGYNYITPSDLLDKPYRPSLKGKKKPTFADLLTQTMDAAIRAGTPWWLLVHRRDKRDQMAYTEAALLRQLTDWKDPPDLMTFPGLRRGGAVRRVVVGMTLDDFFLWVRPHRLRELSRGYKEAK